MFLMLIVATFVLGEAAVQLCNWMIKRRAK